MAREVAVHTAEEHLKDLRIDLLKTSLIQKNDKSMAGKGIAQGVKVWRPNSACLPVKYSKGIKSVSSKKEQIMTVESRKSITSAGGCSEDEVTFSCLEKEVVNQEAMEKMKDDTEDEEEEGQGRGVNVKASGAAEMRKKILWKKLVKVGQRPNSILPECCNCKEVLEGKVYMCQVGHKFCKICLRKKMVESVDLTLTCRNDCGMDIIGRDRGMEAYLQKLMQQSG